MVAWLKLFVIHLFFEEAEAIDIRVNITNHGLYLDGMIKISDNTSVKH